MIYLIIFSIIVLIPLAALIWLHIDRKRYTNFVSKNSLSLRALKELNRRFTFFPATNLDQSYTYDNGDFYETISCTDYLIYQLQFQAEKIFAEIKKLDRNRVEFQRYLRQIEALQFGKFSAPIGTLKEKKLLKFDKQLCQRETIQTPDTQFLLTVTLRCSKINGEIYARKSQIFSSEEVVTLVRRLNNKYRTYYRDREIWDALCRVERGKVSNKLRFEIYARDGYRCRNCGISQRYAVLEIDHIIPISKGGKSTPDNLQTLCHRCNVEKGNEY